ncbi:MAG: glutamine--fructose-6-phosphate transaminase (isomerizing) [Bacteriovoracaceae bacterium]|nr:glutamine--fructose-6-phosphate transaminase (isomerizing) [Bacteriovoracaceae bacterium]
MCGIVGYTGPNNSVQPILEGLSRLEYRGYDSAGICLNINAKLQVSKKEGKLENLRNLLSETNPVSHVGIGHTRWATHGAVNNDNAHPHGNEDFAVVHNGIIENASVLKKELQAEGWVFKSQTDSEVFLVLLSKFAKELGDTLKAIAKAYQTIHGNSAFVIMEKSSDNLYCVKRSAPLVCGLNPVTNEAFVSSDPFALIGYAPEIYFPQDGVICRASVSGSTASLSFFEMDLKPSSRFSSQKNAMSLDVTSKGDHEHFMLKEIYEQPGLLEKLAAWSIKGEGKKEFESLLGKSPDFFHITACGTAWHAGLVIKNFFESYNKIRCNVEIASEFRYRNPILKKGEVGLFISQSGETADTLACQELCKEQGMPTYSIVNTRGSTLFRNCDLNFLIHAGMEIGVASTKAFTQQVLTGFLMSMGYAGKLDQIEVYQEIKTLSDRISQICQDAESIKQIAEKLYQKRGFIFTGRGVYFPIALEGALKLKEIAYVHAEGYAAGELKHGPIALIDDNMVNIALLGPELFEKALSNVEEVKARRGIIFAIGPKGHPELSQISDMSYELDFKGLPNLAPVMVNVVLQLLSYHIAKLKGTDIDKPRNLAKSVTVE